MTFLQKSCIEYSKVEKPFLVTMKYEGSDDEKELEVVPIFNQNNNSSNVVSHSNSGNNNDNANKTILTNILMTKVKRPQNHY